MYKLSDDMLEAVRSQYRRAVADRAYTWVPACGGDEVPFTYQGMRWLYVYNPGANQHAYLNLDTDRIHFDYRDDD